MTFTEWYETYERDGGELMLFNTVDLENAFMAGANVVKSIPHRVMFDEGMRAGRIEAALEICEILKDVKMFSVGNDDRQYMMSCCIEAIKERYRI